MIITLYLDTQVEVTRGITGCLFTDGAIMHTINDMAIKRLRLEPYDGQLSRTVLRGRDHSNVVPLPGNGRDAFASLASPATGLG